MAAMEMEDSPSKANCLPPQDTTSQSCSSVEVQRVTQISVKVRTASASNAKQKTWCCGAQFQKPSGNPFHHLPSMEWRKKIGVPANVTNETLHLPSVNINVCQRIWF